MDDFQVLHELERGEDLLGESTNERNRESNKVVVLYKPESSIKKRSVWGGMGKRGNEST